MEHITAAFKMDKSLGRGVLSGMIRLCMRVNSKMGFHMDQELLNCLKGKL